ncbi:hypothetical protein K9N68_34365 (plasmid) [Kovacikia minuta CCNUW1]|uniref:hypothetical protein n=1 Tax=Kovacikia minuta TaxID=2931930 RepID=UPI001CC94D6B|nr:hypothetical protein [Kovacikia minuta]UBF30301.1 hypothetical protein K9N68_34365 [Kovacikia minuta CCNUW1]
MISNHVLVRVFSLLLGVGIPFSSYSLVNAAETCVSFKPVEGSSYEVRKTVSSSGVTPGVRNNWDTDFVVPGGTNFIRYITTITSETPENYNIIINFRQGDNTSEQVFRRDGARLVGGIPFQIVIAPSASSRQPFQINTNIRGRQGARYRISVSGCSES